MDCLYSKEAICKSGFSELEILYAAAKLSGKFRFDVTGQRDQNFQEGKIYIPDTNFELALIDLGYDNIPDNYLDSNNVIEIIELDLSNKQIDDLTRIH